MYGPQSRIGSGLSINPMAKPARQREHLHIRAVYGHHPLFAGDGFLTYYGGDDADLLGGPCTFGICLGALRSARGRCVVHSSPPRESPKCRAGCPGWAFNR